MRHSVVALALLAPLTACSAPPGTEAARSSSSDLARPQVDGADTGCQIVLRHTYINFEGRLGPQTDCSSGTCWVMIWVTFDVAMSQSLAQSDAFVLFKGAGSPAWQQSAKALPMSGAPVGFRRYQVLLDRDTFTAGPAGTDVSLIPFLVTVGGGRLYDHNRVADPMGSYLLTASNNWTIGDDASVCPGSPPASTLTVNLPTSWNNSATGTLAPNGKLDVLYDIYRLPQTLGCTTDGVAAFATLGYVQFQPSGQVQSEWASGPLDSKTGKYVSLPLEFDVPAGTRSASLWFESSSDCNGGPFWDSDYGRNFVYAAP